MTNALNQNRLMWINIGIVSYFVSIYAIFVLELQHVLIGVFQELMTIPALLSMVVFLVISVRFILKKSEPITMGTKISTLLLGVCAALTISSFF